MQQENIANLDYMAILPESTKGVVAGTPSIFIPLYNEEFKTRINLQDDNPIIGNKWKRYQSVRGFRQHNGSFVVMAEPNTVGHFFNMLMTKGSTTGSGPYTHPFTFSTITNPKSYTIDLKKGPHVHRYRGVEASQITPEWDSNELRINVTAVGLGSWEGREISSISTQDIIFKTDYDPAPTKGLVVGDSLQIYDVSANTYINCAVTAINANGTTITVSGTISAATAGDFVTLRPQTPSYTLLPPFLRTRTEFRFGADAATALSATHTPLEEDSSWSVIHDFENGEEGARRSGSWDPASLPRLQADAEFTARQFFSDPMDIRRFNALEKKAVVIRHFSSSTHELRITLNNIKAAEGPQPSIETGTIDYSEITFKTDYDTADGQACGVTVINGVSGASL